jgi:hypothetical protein
MVGGGIVALTGKVKALCGQAESVGKTGRGLMTSLGYICAETVESLKDLVAEGKTEWQAEQAAVEEARLHTEIPARSGRRAKTGR